MFKKIIAAFFKVSVAAVLVFFGGAVVTDVLSQRYSVIAYNPFWINFMVIYIAGLLLCFIAAMFVSPKVLRYLLPTVIIAVTAVSLAPVSSARLPAYQINIRQYPPELVKCLKQNLQNLAGQTECYANRLKSANNQFLDDYCARRSDIGSVHNISAREYRREQCRYELYYKEEVSNE